MIPEYQECELPDDYPVFPLYWYVVDGKPVSSMVNGTVRDLKADLRHYEGMEAKVVTSCDINGRQKASQEGREYVPNPGRPVSSRP